MEYNLIVKAGMNGTSYHIAYEGIGAHDQKYLSSACGSGITNWGGRDTLFLTKREFNRENITCKKCLKAFDKMVDEQCGQEQEDIKKEIAQLEAKLAELKAKLK